MDTRSLANDTVQWVASFGSTIGAVAGATIAAVVYGWIPLVATYGWVSLQLIATNLVMQPVIRLTYERNEAEGHFRFAHIRSREMAESIAFFQVWLWWVTRRTLSFYPDRLLCPSHSLTTTRANIEKRPCVKPDSMTFIVATGASLCAA